MNIKVSGITSLKQLEQLDGLNVDFAGLDFDRKSPCFVGGKFKAHEIATADLDLKMAGIFVDPGYDEVVDISEKFALDIIQLHGDETPALCEQLSEDFEVMKTFRIDDDTDSIDDLIADYDEVCDYYLFTVANGTGKKFDWNRIAKAKIEKPFFLSGNIGPADAAALKKFRHPDFYGADIDNKFEKEAGVKDMALVLKFLHDLK